MIPSDFREGQKITVKTPGVRYWDGVAMKWWEPEFSRTEGEVYAKSNHFIYVKMTDDSVIAFSYWDIID